MRFDVEGRFAINGTINSDAQYNDFVDINDNPQSEDHHRPENANSYEDGFDSIAKKYRSDL